jgi:hypothetical protein
VQGVKSELSTSLQKAGDAIKKVAEAAKQTVAQATKKEAGAGSTKSAA